MRLLILLSRPAWCIVAHYWNFLVYAWPETENSAI